MATDAAACDPFHIGMNNKTVFSWGSQVVSECFHPGAHVYTRWAGANILSPMKVHIAVYEHLSISCVLALFEGTNT
jgi:hypothetical protein